METTRFSFPDIRNFPYLQNGLLAGVIGAFVVAVYFLVIDVLAGRPFATPSALGAVTFRAEPFDLTRTPELVLIAGYTAIHGTVFIGIASIAAVLMLAVEDHVKSQAARFAGLVASLSIVSTLVFFLFARLFGIDAFDGWRVFAANLLAACAMAVPLGRLHPRDELKDEPDLEDSRPHHRLA